MPGHIAGERSLFVAAGTVDAYVDFSGLSEGDLVLERDGESVKIRLPEAELDKPNLESVAEKAGDRQDVPHPGRRVCIPRVLPGGDACPDLRDTRRNIATSLNAGSCIHLGTSGSVRVSPLAGLRGTSQQLAATDESAPGHPTHSGTTTEHRRLTTTVGASLRAGPHKGHSSFPGYFFRITTPSDVALWW